jgi:hypothetical protein
LIRFCSAMGPIRWILLDLHVYLEAVGFLTYISGG